MKDVKILLGMRIKELRKSCNISQQELAEKINIDQRNLSNIERGVSFPTKSLQDIANALNVSLPDLFDFEYLRFNNEQMINYIIDSLKTMTPKQVRDTFKFVKVIR